MNDGEALEVPLVTEEPLEIDDDGVESQFTSGVGSWEDSHATVQDFALTQAAPTEFIEFFLKSTCERKKTGREG